MKTIVCTILSLFMFTTVCGQKIVTNEVDKFTGCKFVETSVIKTFDPDVDYKLCALNDTLYISAYTKNQSIQVKEKAQAKLYILIGKDNPIILQGVVRNAQQHEHHSGVHWGFGISTGKTRTLTDLEFLYLVPNDVFVLLCSNNITDIRISINDDNIDYHADGFIAKKFRKLFNLMK